MTQFQCVGDACAASCCTHDWQVAVDAPAYDRISKALNQTPAGSALLQRAVVMGGPAAGGAAPFAHIQHQEDGSCPFQEATGLCSLHAQHGPQMLPDACAIFPRSALQVGDRMELGGRLACPEVSRLALLQEHALDLVELSDDVGLRPIPGTAVALNNPTDVYAWAFDDVRNCVVSTLQRVDLPFAVRLALLADLAERLRPFFHRNTAEFLGPRRELSERRLVRELSINTDPALMAALHQEIRGLAVPLTPLVEVLAALLDQRLRVRSNARFPAFATAVLESLGGIAVDANGSRQLRDPAGAAGLYQQRGARLEHLYGAMLERFQRNWSVLYWMQQPYTDAPSLLDHLCRHILRLGMLRLMLLGHPAMAVILEHQQTGQEAAVADAMVEVAQHWARAYEHHPAVLKVMHDALEAHSANTFGRAICLARLF